MNSTLERETGGSEKGRAKMMEVIHERAEAGLRWRPDGSEASSLGCFSASVMQRALIFCNLSCVQCKITDLNVFVSIGC